MVTCPLVRTTSRLEPRFDFGQDEPDRSVPSPAEGDWLDSSLTQVPTGSGPVDVPPVCQCFQTDQLSPVRTVIVLAHCVAPLAVDTAVAA
jgi:hypothetical protein